jgi:hypothetical protein
MLLYINYLIAVNGKQLLTRFIHPPRPETGQGVDVLQENGV